MLEFYNIIKLENYKGTLERWYVWTAKGSVQKQVQQRVEDDIQGLMCR